MFVVWSMLAAVSSSLYRRMIWYGSYVCLQKNNHNNFTVILLGLISLYRRKIWYGSQHTPNNKHDTLTVILLRLSSLYRRTIWYGSQHTSKANIKINRITVRLLCLFFGVCWLSYQIVLLYSELRPNRITVKTW
jgi:hypothetical protein